MPPGAPCPACGAETGRRVATAESEDALPCPGCGYDLRGVPVGAACPECGRDPGQAASSAVPCVGCGYDLRGLPADGHCPECGVLVERSLRGDRLVNSSPEYVRALARGIRLIMVSILISLASGISSAVIGVLGSMPSTLSPTAVQALTSVIQIVGFVGGMLGLVGWWRFTEPDPRYSGRSNPDPARRVVRGAVVVLAVALLLSTITQFIMLGAGIWTPSGPTTTLGTAAAIIVVLSILLGLLSFAAWLTLFFGSMVHLRWLAPRIPEMTVFERAKTYMWLLPVISIVGVCLLYLGPLVALILYYRLLLRIRKGLDGVVVEQTQLGVAAAGDVEGARLL